MKRNFEQELFTEIKYKNHCKKIDKDPNHFCTQKELATNLKMSMRDVGKNLHACVERGLLTHQKIIVKGILRDKFTPVDKRLVDSNEIIKMITNSIESNFATIRDLARKMKTKPALNNIKKVEHGATGKIDKKGMEYLDQFCDRVKDVLSYVDSMNYSLFSDSIKPNSENLEAINKTREHVIKEIEKIINFITKDYSELRKKVIEDSIIIKIPTYYMLLQIVKQAKRKL